MVRIDVAVVVLLVLDAECSLLNTTLKEDVKVNENKLPNTRRKNKDLSTSSSSGARDSHSGGNKESLDLSSLSSSSSKERNKKYPKLKSSLERRGWRKYHRKCQKCPEMRKKWRDPSIKWICGAYQRARRSFKSTCMMHYRNCQDGTMFVKVGNRRCPNSSTKDEPYRGDHFFYDYKVKLLEDSSDSKSDSSSSAASSSFSF